MIGHDDNCSDFERTRLANGSECIAQDIDGLIRSQNRSATIRKNGYKTRCHRERWRSILHGECRVTSLTRPWLYTYTWDEAGRLKTVSKNGTLLVTYAYDHHNRRSRKSTTAAAPQGAQTILYHYDQDDHLIAETRSDGTPLRTYVWLAERPLTVIEHSAVSNPPRSLHLQHDHLGTPRLARNDAGVIQWRWDSDGYGTTTPTHDPDGDGKATVINLRFPGQYYDQESGLYYNWNRYYSPRLGRYLSADPIGIEGGINTYSYVGGNPMSKTDPLGLDPMLTAADNAAGLRPSSPDLRGSKAAEAGACKLVCSVTWPGPITPFFGQALQFFFGQATSYYGCKRICDPEGVTECPPKKTNDVLLDNADRAAGLQGR